MEAQSENLKSSSCFSFLTSRIFGFLIKVKKMGKDDPRRIIHSFKVGLGLTLVSAFYYINPMFKDFGQSVIWAVLTVVLIMEFTVGAAILKGLNRICATFLGGALAVGAHRLEIFSGEKGEPIVIGLLVFVVAAMATYARFIPELKARYDYGVMIFILTFSLVAFSSYRKDNVLSLAKERLSTIAIGVLISFFTSILVFPAWAGDDLNSMTAINLQKLAAFFQGFEEDLKFKSSCPQCHKSVLNSKATEDTLLNFARWEPWHGSFGFRHPWIQYAKIGDQSRKCAYFMEAINVYMASSRESFDKKTQEECVKLSSELGKALREVASAVQSMTVPPTVTEQKIARYISTANQLNKSLLENSANLKEVLPVVSIISLLIEIAVCVQKIMAPVKELARCTNRGTDPEPQQLKANHDHEPTTTTLRGTLNLNPMKVNVDEIKVDIGTPRRNSAQLARRTSFSPRVQFPKQNDSLQVQLSTLFSLKPQC